MSLFELLDQYEENEKPILQYLSQDESHMIEFLKLVVETPSDVHPKYPFIVSELLYGSYDQLLQLMFEWEGKPLNYLLTFNTFPQNDTSCGYLEKCLRPLILLKATEFTGYLKRIQLFALLESESIQNIYITILDCGNIEDNLKQELINTLIEQLADENHHNAIFRIIVKEQDQFKKYIQEHENVIDYICNKCQTTYFQLIIVELLFTWDHINLEWIHRQLTQLKQHLIQPIELNNIKQMNFQYHLKGLGENDLKIIQILSMSINRPETLQFQEILLELIIKHQWNNALQNIAIKMYQEMATNQSPHTQYFTSIISQFITQKVGFEEKDYGLQHHIAPGYRWVFTRIVSLFALDFPIASNIYKIDQTFLLNEDPSNTRERSSFNILEKVFERRQQLWTKRIQEEDQDQQNKDEDIPKGRNSFGIKPPIEEEVLEIQQQQQQINDNQNEEVIPQRNSYVQPQIEIEQDQQIPKGRNSCQFQEEIQD